MEMNIHNEETQGIMKRYIPVYFSIIMALAISVITQSGHAQQATIPPVQIGGVEADSIHDVAVNSRNEIIVVGSYRMDADFGGLNLGYECAGYRSEC